MRASKHGGVGGGGAAENNRGISGHVYTLHHVSLTLSVSEPGLCGNGAKKLLENGEALVQTMVTAWIAHIVLLGWRIQTTQCLAADQQGCLRMTKLCCEPLVKAIVCGMNRRNWHSGKVSTDHMSLLVEACRLAQLLVGQEIITIILEAWN
ncbi:hypothetical protein LWI28_029168 [Acer negundo]|uniref:Uncharacterized protein n=1 Tax=Acer negundo TaxID=4023 RepID=A0AAD5NHD5_ACENE|nr:hypothetical protein LWI28_029168 [Acer negundo]